MAVTAQIVLAILAACATITTFSNAAMGVESEAKSGDGTEESGLVVDSNGAAL